MSGSIHDYAVRHLNAVMSIGNQVLSWIDADKIAEFAAAECDLTGVGNRDSAGIRTVTENNIAGSGNDFVFKAQIDSVIGFYNGYIAVRYGSVCWNRRHRLSFLQKKVEWCLRAE